MLLEVQFRKPGFFDIGLFWVHHAPELVRKEGSSVLLLLLRKLLLRLRSKLRRLLLPALTLHLLHHLVDNSLEELQGSKWTYYSLIAILMRSCSLTL